MIFEADTLDDRNWVIDFGQFKSLRKNLEEFFDHKTVIAEDDPCRLQFRELETEGALELRILPKVGCEAFAEHIAKLTMVEPVTAVNTGSAASRTPPVEVFDARFAEVATTPDRSS